MSWSEGRTSVAAGDTGPRKEALDRVDGLLRALARDELLHDDLKHPDVLKALEHWTGKKRLSEDEADELMEDNYRIQSVCKKMAELQTCCKEAGIGLPLSQVIAGKGLYDSISGGGGKGSSQVIGETRENAGSGDRSQSFGDSKRRPPKKSTEAVARGDKEQVQTAAKAATATKPAEASSWKKALIEELWRGLLLCVCAVVFSLGLKFFRGNNPLGPSNEADLSRGQDGEL